MTQVPVHEAVEVKGVVEALEVPIEHCTESSLSAILLKIDRYSTLGAGESYRRGKHSSSYGAFGRAFLTFLQNYFLRRGFMDGAQGLTLAVTDSVNKFFKYAKLSELERTGRGAESTRSSENRGLPKTIRRAVPPLKSNFSEFFSR